MTKEQQLVTLLDQLSSVMRELKLWQRHKPADQALQSAEPFAVDTLQPEQWLQWVFLPKMAYLLEQKMPLPAGFAITPYFEECWKEHGAYAPLLDLLRAIDEACA
ncbi:YqcC family protein [Vibrio coralliilyticus]|uniref:YqcC family protein n=1 Tax=Vibrio coralliilyticus TaxID=190893 RepID=UPI000BAABC3A|nr:YqcC family protein [Vibrio coralliilyticus]NOI56470.1 YqcC family protein [Vibrio coralliilyticus]PAT66430.1 pseudouridine synthase [Vibrio coralliilyticus]